MKINPQGLNSLIRALGRTVQAHGIQNVLNYYEDHQIPTLSFDNLLFDPWTPLTASRKQAMDLIVHTDTKYKISLSRDLILPWPWFRSRISSAFAEIGFGKKKGDWEADHNHLVTIVLPFGACFVDGGNHSISAGIVNGEGSVINSSSWDISPLYTHVKFDGHVYRRTFDNSIIHTPGLPNSEFGAIFEIGRLMVEQGIRYDGQPCNSQSRQESSDDEKYQIRYAVYKNNVKQLYDLTASAVTFHLSQQGLIEGSNHWNSVFRGESSILIERFGKKVEYKFIPYFPVPLYGHILH